MQTPNIRITQADKHFYNEKGYWISPKLLDDDQIERLKLAHDRIWKGDFDGDGGTMYGQAPWSLSSDPLKLRKLDNGWWINNEVRKTVTMHLIGELAADLMESDEVRLWHDQVIYKPGTANQQTSAGNVGWHQDYGYWGNSSTTNMITVWIALQDTDLTNGGMSSIAGSHKWGLVPDSDTFFDQDLDALKHKYMKEGKAWIEEPCILKAGEASFHHSLTFHGSGPNLTNKPRLSVVSHLMPKGTAYKKVEGKAVHENVRYLGPNVKEGDLFAGEFFPQLYAR